MTTTPTRKYAHQLVPHPGEGETKPVDYLARYHYAQALAWWAAFFDEPGMTIAGDYALMKYIGHSEMAVLYDALAQDMVGQEAADWARRRCHGESIELLTERALALGIDWREVAPYEPGRLHDRTLRDMAHEVAAVNRANGWYEDDRTVGDDLALLHSEVSEALEAYRDHGLDDATIEIDPTLGILPKPEGFGSELADVFIRLLDTAHRRGINLGAEYRRKIAFNRTRKHRHGGKRL